MERQDISNTIANLAAEDAPPERSPLGVLWRAKALVVLLGLIGGGIGYLYYVKSPAVFQSAAQLLIIKRDATLPVLGSENRGTYQDEAPLMHSTVVTSPEVLGKAIEKFALGSLVSMRGQDNPMGVIAGGMTSDSMKSGNGTTILTLTYKGGDAQDCATILNGVIKTYQDFLGENYHNFSDETVQLISQAKDVLLKQLTEKEANYRKFRQDSPLWRGASGSNLHESRLSEIEQHRSRVIVEQAQTKSRIDALEAAMKNGGNRQAIAMLVGSITAANNDVVGKPKLTSDEALAALQMEEQTLLAEVGPNHPKVKALRTRMDVLHAYQEKRSVAASDKAADKAAPAPDYLATYVESLYQDLKLQAETLQGLDELFKREQDAAKQLAVFQVQDETFQSEITRTQQLFNAVVKRLDEINLVKDLGGLKTQLLSLAGAGVQIAPKFYNILGMGLVLGAMAGFGIGYLLEVLDRRFASPEDVRRSVGLPILGHVPMIDSEGDAKSGTSLPGAETLAPVLCVAHNPKGRKAEAYRAIRTGIYFSTYGKNHKVVQVTSPSSGDGKTTTATNLAISIAESGKKTLLIDADFRRPRVDKQLGVENTLGFSTVIAGKAELPDCIQATSIANLSVLTSGGRPEKPAELLTSTTFQELLAVLREQYDFVIIDTPPILAVTDPLVVAPRVDAVLLVIRLTKNARAAVSHAKEALASVGGSVLGVIINAVSPKASPRYGYSGYKYGYGKSYGYGYKYGYKAQYGYQYGYGYTYGYGKNRRYGYGDDEAGYRDYYTDEETAPGQVAGNGSSAANGNGKPSANGNGKVRGHGDSGVPQEHA